MKVSVIIPAWQCDDTIGECLKSVRGSIARYDGDIEFETLVVISRGSVAASRNEGLGLAKGDYIAWVDADDEVAPDWAPQLAAALEANPDVVAFDAHATWWDTRKDYTIGIRSRSAKDFFLDVASGVLPGQLWSKVFRRELLHGLEFIGTVHEDFRLQCEIAARTVKDLKVVCLPVPLYVYHRRSAGVSQYSNTESVGETLEKLVCFGLALPDRIRECALRGITLRVADFLWNSPTGIPSKYPKLTGFLRSNRRRIVFSSNAGMREKLKCMLAGWRK